MHRMPAQAATRRASAVPQVPRSALRAQRSHACGRAFGVGATGSDRPWSTTSITLGKGGDPAP